MAARIEPYALIDTNVLAYAYDQSEPVKQKRALEVLRRLHRSGAGALSVQILGEFFNVLTRKLSQPVSTKVARQRVGNYLVSWPVLPLTPMVVQEAIRGVVEYQLHFFDAQIWAVAKLNQLPAILSEDFSHNAVIEGVRFKNPFDSGFDVDEFE